MTFGWPDAWLILPGHTYLVTLWKYHCSSNHKEISCQSYHQYTMITILPHWYLVGGGCVSTMATEYTWLMLAHGHRLICLEYVPVTFCNQRSPTRHVDMTGHGRVIIAWVFLLLIHYTWLVGWGWHVAPGPLPGVPTLHSQVTAQDADDGMVGNGPGMSWPGWRMRLEPGWFVSWLMSWSINWLINWFVNWFMNWSTHWFRNWLTWFFNLLVTN